MMETVTASDGHEFDCWVEAPAGERRGGLVILQEIFGVTDQLKEVAADYAAFGREVAIPALFDRRERGRVIPFDDIGTARSMMRATDLDGAMADIAATVERLGAPCGVMGFCWGGHLAFHAAARLPVACAVSFYGTMLDGVMDLKPGAPMQGHWGTEDTHAPGGVLERLGRVFPAMEIFAYEGAGHAFANHRRPDVHDADAAALMHSRAKAFLDMHPSR